MSSTYKNSRRGVPLPQMLTWGDMADCGLVKAADQCRDDVAVFRVVVVAGAVQVGGHHAAVVNAVVGSVLAVVAFTELDAGNLGNGVWLVGRLQRAGQQGAFGHGLVSQAWVDAARAEYQQFFYATAKGRFNHIGLHHQVLVDEVCRVCVVGVDAAHLGCGQIHLIGFAFCEKGLHLGLVAQVQFGVAAGNDGFSRHAIGQQFAHDG